MADMKKQQDQIITQKRRRAFAWVACFALLFGVLAMPMTPTMPRPEGERLAWGSACIGAASRLAITPVEVINKQMPYHPGIAFVRHCDCCTHATPLVAVPTRVGLGLFALIEPVRFPVAVLVLRAPPRQHWPDRNPHASPKV
ncbi:DUF2946 domain-containing protein [Pseudomonas sp. 15A4]|jgi:hypothetical protein|uniref:DUF2946 family protein n=1 Tax=Pseudomonas sp. 15A4 TaxID=2804761 RepID=UPI001967B51D|nr:DUF2946 family protein [Pseudomonas sp. 15A4]QSB19756.1 DUF2946 domain-containing protein [Pseudomonas sp. 15A4]